MAKVTVPGLKNSTGMKTFEPLVGGRYRLKVTEVSVNPPKNQSPSDVYKFTMQVMKGPDQSDGKNPKGLRYFHNLTIMQEAHPSFEKYGFIGVDELKSMCLAFGVAPKGDSIDIDAFLGLESDADITQKLEENQNGEDVKRNHVTKWLEAK